MVPAPEIDPLDVRLSVVGVVEDDVLQFGWQAQEVEASARQRLRVGGCHLDGEDVDECGLGRFLNRLEMD